MENPHKTGKHRYFLCCPSVTSYPLPHLRGNIWCPKESGGLCGNGGALGYQVVETTQKTSSGLISHVYVSKSSIFWGITWFFISNFNDQSEWVREMMLVWRRSANKTRTHCYWISSVDEGVLRFFSQLWVVFHSRAWSEIPPQCINLPTESTMGCSSISIANSPMYNDML